MRKISVTLLCLTLATCLLAGCITIGTKTDPTTPESFSIGLTDFSESDIRILEEEFDVSLTAPVKVESLYYFWDARRGPTFSMTLTGVPYENYMEHNIHFTWDGYGIDKHGEHVWIEMCLVDREEGVPLEGIRLKKEVISTLECMALLGIESVYRNEYPYVAAPPSTISTITSKDITGANS